MNNLLFKSKELTECNNAINIFNYFTDHEILIMA